MAGIADKTGAGAHEAPGDRDPMFEKLLDYLRDSRAFDFTGYKRPSLMRRVQLQMSQVGIGSFEEYHDYLQVHPEEFTNLFNTILINVTGFFRDEDAWRFLSESVVPLLIERSNGAPLRVWSAGCASGQEAYGLAMAFAELLGPTEFRERVKIYATDVDEDALAIARAATYTDKEMRGVPAEYAERYFEKLGSRFAFRKDLRRSVIFGRNDLVQDAPISRIDLLVCRNCLMYFNADTQTRIVRRLGFAVKPEGVLFLGKAEMLLNHTHTFEPIDLKRRFFRKLGSADAERVLELGRRGGRSAFGGLAKEPDYLGSEAYLTGPVAHIVVDADECLAMVNHRATSLLGLTERDVGRPFHELEVSFRPAELRSQIANAHAARVPIWLRDVEWHRSAGERLYLDIQVIPLVGPNGRFLGTSIIFNDMTRVRQMQDELEATNRQLETAYEELQSTNEELETTNEELQSTVEELETTNEELQSTNEELETMNEELQSMNDELQLTNDEIRVRTSEVNSLNTFMESILGSLNAGIVVVNRDLMVQVWNGQAKELWGLHEDETVGMHLLNIDSGMPIEELKPVLRAVIHDAEPSAQKTMNAINRRGRSIELRVTATPLTDGTEQPAGALLLMEPISE